MFNLVEIDKNEFRVLFSEIEPSHTKWLSSYFHLKDSVCFRIYKSESQLQHKPQAQMIKAIQDGLL